MKRKKSDSQQLRSLLKKEQALPKAVAALIRSLDATRTYAQNGRAVSEPDFATQTKAALGLLQWSASPPPRAKDEPPPPDKRTEAEKTAEIIRVLGIE